MADVRGKGFGEPTSIEGALAILVARVVPLVGEEEVPLDEALGRVLAVDVASAVDVPAFRKACMDGFAVRAADTYGASSYDPATLDVVPGTVLPGTVGATFGGPSAVLGAGQALRIMTGARLPEGADAVLPWERAEVRGADAGERVRVVAALAPGKHVARPGEDVRRGAQLLAAGRRLRPADLGLLASVGLARVKVRRRPRVAVLPSGDELLDPTTTTLDEASGALAAGRTFESNGVLLAACVRSRGLQVRRARALPDRRAELEAALLDAEEELLLTTGATSTGQEDVLPLVLAEKGELWVHGVDLRPGHPVGLGRLGTRHVALLPGNPVAAWTCFQVLVVPLLRLLEGEPAGEALRTRRRRGRLLEKLTSAAGRTDVVRVTIDEAGGVRPLPGGSSALLGASRADGLVRVARDLEGLEAGAEVWVEDVS